jgi:deazaflavin-dependent oxidoreductase (nitroreductase family)
MKRTSRWDKEAGDERRRPWSTLLRRLGATRLGVLVIKHVVSPLDRCLYQRTGGRRVALGRPLSPLLLLTTKGAAQGKSTQPPSTTSGMEPRLVLCNVNPGFEHPNPWTLNLWANPLAIVQIGSEKSIYQAREASQAEVDHYWPQLVHVWPAYQTFYERSGQRVIFLLEPVSPSHAATV